MLLSYRAEEEEEGLPVAGLGCLRPRRGVQRGEGTKAFPFPGLGCSGGTHGGGKRRGMAGVLLLFVEIQKSSERANREEKRGGREGEEGWRRARGKRRGGS